MKRDQADESGVRGREPGSERPRAPASGKLPGADAGSRPQPRAPVQADTGSQKASRKPRTGARTGARPLSSGRHTISTGALEAGVTGSFGQGVVTEQTKRGNPLVWIAAIVIVGALLYFGYTILTAK